MKRIPHFYAFASRLGMQNPPIYKEELNRGVEEAPSAILTPEFLQTFSSPSVDQYNFPNPELLEKEEMVKAIVDSTLAAKKQISATLKPNETQVVIGGDNSVTFPSILAVLDRIEDPHDVGYIQIDSHGDMNTFADSISKNWHGMYLRPLFGDDFDMPEVNKLVSKKLVQENAIYIGNLDLDPKEKEFFDSTRITHLAASAMRHNSSSLDIVHDLFARIKHLHLTIDIDAFDKSIAPATGLPAEHGLLFEDIEKILKMTKDISSCSVDLVEVNPQKEGAQKTVEFAHKLLHQILI